MRLNPHLPAYYLSVLGHAYHLLGRIEEAIAILKRAVARNPNFLGAHVVLARIYGELNQKIEARAEGAEILRISPNFSLEDWKKRFPHRDSAVVERFLTALRKAGLK
jgi:adenylate cyclase